MDIYPLTIIFDRYMGTYSRGVWTAWNTLPQDIPQAIFESDVPCGNFWYEYPGIVGRGTTPEEAIENLSGQLNG